MNKWESLQFQRVSISSKMLKLTQFFASLEIEGQKINRLIIWLREHLNNIQVSRLALGFRINSGLAAVHLD